MSKSGYTQPVESVQANVWMSQHSLLNQGCHLWSSIVLSFCLVVSMCDISISDTT